MPYALVLLDTGSLTWQRGMVVEVRSDSVTPGLRERPPKMMVVRLPSITPISALNDWIEPLTSPILDSTGRLTELARRKQKLDVAGITGGVELRPDQELSASLTEMNDRVIVVTDPREEALAMERSQ